jgi:hypothetical protein
MDDPGYSTSPLDQPLDDKVRSRYMRFYAPSHPQRRHHYPKALNPNHRRSSIYTTTFPQNPINRFSHFLFINRISRLTRVSQANPTTLAHPNASSSFVPSDILFTPDAPLSQQERGIMADITLDPDAWLWSFDDASPPNRDASPPKVRSPFFFFFLPNWRGFFFYTSIDNAVFFFPPNQPPSAPPTTTLPPPPVVASASSSVSPSPFAPPSRSPRERDADKPIFGHAPLLSEDADMRVQVCPHPESHFPVR